jgi:hypothetical protein
MTLILIGHWHSEQEPEWPDPGRFVDFGWDTTLRARVADYLDSGDVLAAAGGASWCRFHCRGHSHWGVGNLIRTDWHFAWPSGLTHYVREHGVRLPDQVSDHVLSGRRIPERPALAEFPEFDHGWWQRQHGFGSSVPTHRAPGRRGRLEISACDGRQDPSLLLQLRRFAAVPQVSVRELAERLARGTPIPVLERVYLADVSAEIASLEGLGLRVAFVEGEGAG